MIRKGSTLIPDGVDSHDALSDVPAGKPLEVEIKQPRNSAFHRKFFALCKRVADGIGKDTEWVATALKIETGHVDVISYGGKTHVIPRSIAFHAMDDIEFHRWFNECVDIIYRIWKIDPSAINDILLPEEVHKTK